jgi:hypothetical protein
LRGIGRQLVGLVRSRLLSPRGLLWRATVLTAAFLLLHLLGLREDTCVFSGTSPTGGTLDTLSAVAGASYAVLYLLVVVVVPVLVIAALLLLLANLWRRRRLDRSDARTL